MLSLEERFNADMENIYITAKKEFGYNATRFFQMLQTKGGLSTAKQLIKKTTDMVGLTTLWEHGRLDLSVEAHVLKTEYQELFTDEERQICKDRLLKFGYKI